MTSSPAAGIASEPADTAGSEYSAYVAQLLAEQDARKASIEQRGLAVISTSGSLATLLFALVAVVTSGDNFELPSQANGPIGAALVSFVLAGVLGLLTNLPLVYSNIDLSDPNKLFWDHWDKGVNDARQRVVATRLRVLKSAQKLNNLKGYSLIAALFVEVAGVAAVAIAVSEILQHG
jgi:hypothetical protein